MATYSPLPTEEPGDAITQPDSEKETSVNISVSCPSNNFCTWRLIYVLVVAAIVCIFVLVAVYQTVLKAILVVVVVAIIAVLSYVAYAYFYVNKIFNLTARKDSKVYANAKKHKEDTESTTEPVVNIGDIESVACGEENDDVEIIDLPVHVATGFQSDDAVGRTPEDSDEIQEQLTIHGHTDPKMTYITEHGAIYNVVENTKNIATQRRTKNITVVFGGNNIISAGPVHISRPGEFQLPDWKPHFDVIAKEMPADWQQLATNLGLPWAQIRAVDRQHSGDCWSCCQQVLDMWRKNYGRRARAEDLIQAVRETGNQDVAEKLEDMEIEVQPWVPFPRPKHRAPLPPVPTQHKD